MAFTLPCVALRKLILTLAVRIKADRPWPEKPARYEIGGFRIWVDRTPQQAFKRVVITTPEAGPMRVTLVDANPAKVRDAHRKVMVYFRWAPGPERVGQVRLCSGREPELVWFPPGDQAEPAGRAKTRAGLDHPNPVVRAARRKTINEAALTEEICYLLRCGALL